MYAPRLFSFFEPARWLIWPLVSWQEAIANMTKLAEFKPMWIEEPTNCDDVIGHVSCLSIQHTARDCPCYRMPVVG
jgi:hypothetical protein